VRPSRHLQAADDVRRTGFTLAVLLIALGLALIAWPCPGDLAGSAAECSAVLIARADQLGDLLLALGAVAGLALGGSSATAASSAQRHRGAAEGSSALSDAGPP
jgi:hypothetical protein